MNTREQLEAIGKKIWNASRTELYLSMRFFGVALDSLGYEADLSTRTVGTDGETIRFNPRWVMEVYLEHPYMLNRAYVHMILHCLFRHMSAAGTQKREDLWNLACDIAAESVLDTMESPAVRRTPSDFREEWYARLKAEVRVLTAEKIYQYFLGCREDYPLYLKLQQEFQTDDHSFWERLDEQKAGEGQPGGGPRPEQKEAGGDDPQKTGDHGGPGEPETAGENSRPESGTDRSPEERNSSQEPGTEGTPEKQLPEAGGSSQEPGTEGTSEKQPSGEGDSPQKSGADRDPVGKPADGRKQNASADRNHRAPADGGTVPPGLRRTELEERWKEHARRIASELEMQGSEASADTGSLSRMLAVTTRKRRDYREFLRRFSVVREEASVDPDSFDYGFYNYGMELYGNVPLIEENEFREVRRVDELVIAIDTSASCQDRLVQKFLNDTADLLARQENFFHKVEIRILECDDQVQKDVKITDVRQMETYAKGFHMKGGYGTDFRPVFSYVARLRRQGQLPHLKGLLYFTDGFGIYPTHPTDYATAFVFHPEEEMNDGDVPDWAMRLYLEE